MCGVKLFMGASTGNMLVDQERTLQAIFAEVDMLIAAHCEQEDIIRKNIVRYEREFGEAIPIEYHPLLEVPKRVTALRPKRWSLPTGTVQGCTCCTYLPGGS